ncbi:MAG: response regulator, partial [Magnetococcales bacterium]|nr:response regulator [Magnetococcales bacterium]
MAGSLNAMVVDDTITYRMIMKKVAESIPGISVTSTVSNGKLALDKLGEQIARNDPERPDIVLLDVEMPVMDGITTLKEIRKRYPQLTVVMVSALSRSNANIILECLNAGALDFVTKPLETNVERAKAALRKDLEPILALLAQDQG